MRAGWWRLARTLVQCSHLPGDAKAIEGSGDRPMTSPIKWSARTAKVAALCLALLLAGGSYPGGAAAASDPQGTVRSFYGTLLGTMQDGRTLGQSGRYARLAPIVG